MTVLRPVLGALLAASLVAGCKSTTIGNRQEYEGPRLPRPDLILVYDFAATPADLPSWSNESSTYLQAAAPVDEDELAAGRKLGADLAQELVTRINAMGMVAARARNQPGPDLNNLAIVGYFSTIDEGSAVERVVIGFGKGSAEVNAHVAGYHMTEEGMQRLGSADVGSGGAGKSPGLIVPALVTVATANPIGLAVGGAVKAEGEISGRTTDEGSVERIADEIANALKPKFEQQGWL